MIIQHIPIIPMAHFLNVVIHTPYTVLFLFNNALKICLNLELVKSKGEYPFYS